jgi:hypothetical protein
MPGLLKRGLIRQVNGLDLNFATGRYALNGDYRSDITNVFGWSFTRASVGTALDASNNIIQFASGAPRITNRGILVEESRTNLLLNSATLGTQSVTTTAVAHTLSFYGTGTVTLTGTSTAGPLVGTGANNLVTLTFTPTAGTLTLTVVGSVTSAQLEAGSFATSYIPTTGATVTRARDNFIVTGLNIPAPYTIAVDLTPLIVSTVDIINTEASGLTAVGMYINGASNAQSWVQEAGVTTANPAPNSTLVAGNTSKLAARYSLNNTNSATNGVLASFDPLNSPPTITRINLGNATYSYSGGTINSYSRRVQILPYAATDAQLQALTA